MRQLLSAISEISRCAASRACGPTTRLPPQLLGPFEDGVAPDGSRLVFDDLNTPVAQTSILDSQRGPRPRLVSLVLV